MVDSPYLDTCLALLIVSYLTSDRFFSASGPNVDASSSYLGVVAPVGRDPLDGGLGLLLAGSVGRGGGLPAVLGTR